MNKKLIRVVAAFMIMLMLLFGDLHYASATINGYLGSGYFPTGNLNRCHQGSGYATQTQNASARWSADTDLNMYYNCTGTHIWTKYQSYGNTGWAGMAYICNTSNQCGTSALNGTYKSCESRLNQTYISGNPLYTNAEVQKLATHELGHCYSLDHANVSGSVMAGGSVPNSQDINLINARY